MDWVVFLSKGGRAGDASRAAAGVGGGGPPGGRGGGGGTCAPAPAPVAWGPYEETAAAAAKGCRW